MRFLVQTQLISCFSILRIKYTKNVYQMTDKSMADYPYSKVPLLYPKNQIKQDNTPYIGLYYAGKAEGGFSIEQGAHYIELIKLPNFEQYDMTNAIQIGFDVRILNEKLGLIKSDDHTIISTTFNGRFPVDQIKITVTEFLSQINLESIISFEPWKYIMDRFTDYISNYFNGVFAVKHEPPLTKETFVQLFKTLKTTMQGEINVKHIYCMLEDFIHYNAFGNRTENEGIEYGFMTGDLLYIPNGLSITLSMNVMNNNITLNDLVMNSTTNCVCCGPPVKLNVKDKVSYTNPTALTYTIQTPLLLKLVYPTF